MFTTSDICLALLEEPSTLKTSIGWEIVQVLIPLEWTKSQSIKLSVMRALRGNKFPMHSNT